MKWEDNNLHIGDIKSKFGSLVLLNKPHKLIPGKHLTLQCANSVLEFNVVQSWTIFSCLGFSRANNIAEEEKEEIKAQANNLPGNGKHSVLVIRKKSYEKLLQNGERIKKEALNKSVCISIANNSKQSKLDKELMIGHSMQYFRQQTIALPEAKRNIRRSENHIGKNINIIQKHRGDAGEDVNVDDCE